MSDTMCNYAFCVYYQADPNGFVCHQALRTWRDQARRAATILGAGDAVERFYVKRPDEWPYPHPKTPREQARWLREDLSALRDALASSDGGPSWDEVATLTRQLWLDVRAETEPNYHRGAGH